MINESNQSSEINAKWNEMKWSGLISWIQGISADVALVSKNCQFLSIVLLIECNLFEWWKKRLVHDPIGDCF